MNDLIKQLYEQAHEEMPPILGTARLTRGILWNQPKKFNPELFAKLIVERCIEEVYPQWMKEEGVEPHNLADAVARVRETFDK